ncbi:hypothetical protein [Vibrio diabolicus]|uniref:hypothetical protein n=1 Tax=Vibrio diabolicus TaxID=50719 RepID=UPI00232D5E2C|nr:hypothetical protein [Vibrio diabolicus]
MFTVQWFRFGGSVAHTLMRRYGSTATISYKDLIMADLLSSVSTAISLATRLREIGKNIEDAEFKNILADLSLELADSKLKMADLISENAALKEKLAALTSAQGSFVLSVTIEHLNWFQQNHTRLWVD